MGIEKLATSAVETAIEKTDRLSSFINSGDKEPCWDGNIYIHEGKNHTKKNIKKVATQVKGKKVKPHQVADSIKYRISSDDLTAYMMNGGTMFFVVYIDEKSKETLQIYYAALLPMKIKGILSETKGSHLVSFQKFPSDNLSKTEIFLNFYDNAQRQASFAGKDLPTIEELTKQGVLESLTFHYTGIGNYHSERSIPKMMNGKSMTIYANIKGGSVPIPVEYCENIQRVTMSQKHDLPIYVDGVKYYDGYSIVTTADNLELHIGSCVRIVTPNMPEMAEAIPVTMKVKIKGTLNEQIKGIEFISAMLEHGSFHIGEYEFPSKFPLDQLSKIKFDEFRDLLPGYKRALSVLESMHVTKELEISKCNDEDIRKLNLLIGTIGDKRPVKGVPEVPNQVSKFTIANLTLAVVCLLRPEGGYYIWDYFGEHFSVSWAPNGSDPVDSSQFFALTSEDILAFDNLNAYTIVEDYKRIEAREDHLEQGNQTMLEMLKAYDSKENFELLDAAKQMCEWIQNYPQFVSPEIAALNRLQITRRERELSVAEKAELYSIMANAPDNSIRLGVLLLLDEQVEAKKILEALPQEEREKFKDYPIFKFYKPSDQ